MQGVSRSPARSHAPKPAQRSPRGRTGRPVCLDCAAAQHCERVSGQTHGVAGANGSVVCQATSAGGAEEQALDGRHSGRHRGVRAHSHLHSADVLDDTQQALAARCALTFALQGLRAQTARLDGLLKALARMSESDSVSQVPLGVTMPRDDATSSIEDNQPGDRVELEKMKADARLSQACALTAIALMGFSTVENFRRFRVAVHSADQPSANGLLPDRDLVDRVNGWLEVSGEGGNPLPMDSDAAALLLGKSAAAEAEKEWRKYESGVKAWEQTIPGHEHASKVTAAIRPFMDLNAAVDNGGVRVGRIAYAFPGDPPPSAEVEPNKDSQNSWTNITVTDEHVNKLKEFVKKLQQKDVASISPSLIQQFGAFVRALFARTGGTLGERYCAALGAAFLYDPAGQKKLSEKEYEVLAYQLVPRPLGSSVWRNWTESASTQPARQAEAISNRPYDTLQGRGTVRYVLWALDLADLSDSIDKAFEDEQLKIARHILLTMLGQVRLEYDERAVERCIRTIVEIAIRSCVDVPQNTQNLRVVHDKVHSIVGDQSGEGTDAVQIYINEVRNLKNGQPGPKASKSLVEVLKNENASYALGVTIIKRVVDAAKLPQGLRDNACDSIDKEGINCDEKRRYIEYAKVVEETAQRKDNLGEPRTFVDDLVKLLRKRVTKVAGPKKDEIMKKFEELSGKVKEQPADVKKIYEYITKVLALIDDAHPVRVVITIRTNFTSQKDSRTALDTAAAFIENADKTGPEQTPAAAAEGVVSTGPEPNPAGSNEDAPLVPGVLDFAHIHIPRSIDMSGNIVGNSATAGLPTDPGDNKRKFGPFYKVVLNGTQIPEAIRGVMDRTLKGTGLGPAPHFVYSAYGLSGAGKTRTLLSDPEKGSVLETVIAAIESSPSVQSVSVAMTDVYSEEFDQQAPAAPAARQPRNVTQRAATSHSPVRQRRGGAAGELPGNAPGNLCSGEVTGKYAVPRNRAHLIQYKQQAFNLDAPGLDTSCYNKMATYSARSPLFVKFSREDVKLIPTKVDRITQSKKEYNFAEEGQAPIVHIRPTPNNDESSRAHTALTLKLHGAEDKEIARVTLLDMAGAEDVDSIQNSYFRKDKVPMVKMQTHIKSDQTNQSKVYAYITEANTIDPMGALKEGLKVSGDTRLDVEDVGKFFFGPFGLGNAIIKDGNENSQNKQFLGQISKFEIKTDEKEIDTFRVKPWANLANLCQATRPIALEVLTCPPSAQALAESVLARDAVAEGIALMKTFRTKLPDSQFMNFLVDRSDPTFTEFLKAKTEGTGSLTQDKFLTAAMTALVNGGTFDLKLPGNIDTSGLSEELTGALCDLGKYKSIKYTMPQTTGGNKRKFILITNDTNRDGSHFPRTMRENKYPPNEYVYIWYKRLIKRFLMICAIDFILNSKSELKGNTIFKTEYLKKLADIKVMNVSNEEKLKRIPPIDVADCKAPMSFRFEAEIDKQFKTTIEKWTNSLKTFVENAQHYNEKVQQELRVYDRELSSFPNDDWVHPKDTAWFKYFLNASNQTEAGSYGHILLKRFREFQAARKISKDARQALQCPLRFQGNSIARSLEQVKAFVKSLSSSNGNAAAEDADWIKAILAKDNAKFAEGEKEALKFVQFVAVRADFPITASSGAEDDVQVNLRRKGMVDSIKFADELNPLSNNQQ